MKKNIFYLIHNDLMMNRLVTTLRRLEIDAISYTTNNVLVIFDLMSIPCSDLLMNAYFQMIERSADLETYGNAETLKELAEEVYDFLETFSEAEWKEMA
jgi:hypothetical protein